MKWLFDIRYLHVHRLDYYECLSKIYLSNQKASESGYGDAFSPKTVSINVSHPDAVPLLEVQYSHVGTSLVICITITQRSDLWHAVQYDLYLEMLFEILNSGDVEDIGSSHRGREDSCTRVVSITDIQDNTIENQSPTPPSWAAWCYSSCKSHLLFEIC